MHYFVLLTTCCDLKCRYCYGANLDDLEFGNRFEDLEDVPAEIQYKISELREFVAKDPDPVIILYGGEPLLRIDKMKQIMDEIPARYMLQTNGLKLRELGKDHVNRLENVMFSIDGEQKLTDFYRGKGVYEQVINNARWLKSVGFGGEVLARMTVQEQTDISRQVKHILSGPFDSVHWQLNANFWNSDLKNRRFTRWVRESYNQGITELIGFWIKQMEKGRVLRIYPFVGVMQSLLKDEDSMLRCGAGWAQYAVLTNGKISPCPVMAGMREYYVGDLKTDPRKLPHVLVGGLCDSCDTKNLCGGRCLFANKTMFWGEDGFRQVCSTAKHLISELQRFGPDIEKLINSGRVSINDFDYPKFNSCEIIP